MPDPAILLLSEPTPDALRASAGAMIERAGAAASALPDAAAENAWVHDVATQLALRTPKPHRAAILAEDVNDLLNGLAAVRDGTATGALASEKVAVADATRDARVLFLYPGQGSQRLGDDAAIARHDPSFAARVRELEAAFGDPPLSGFLSDAWRGDPGAEAARGVNNTAVSQPMLAVLGVAATEALGRLGVRPSLTLGHSVGEFGALYGAGWVGTSDVVGLIRERVACMRHAASGSGLLAVRASAASTEALLADHPGVHVACDNAPDQIVVGGGLDDLTGLEARLDCGGVLYSRLRTAAAFHTPHFADADTRFRAVVGSHEWDEPTPAPDAACISSVSGALVGSRDEAAALLGRQLAGTVRFREAARSAHAAVPDVIVQVSGGDSLIRMYRKTNPEYSGRVVAFGGTADNPAGIALAIGELFLAVSDFTPHRILSKGVASMSWTHSWTHENSVVTGGRAQADAPPARNGVGEAAAPRPHAARTPVAPATETPAATPAPGPAHKAEPTLPPAAVMEQVLGLLREQATIVSSLLCVQTPAESTLADQVTLSPEQRPGVASSPRPDADKTLPPRRPERRVGPSISEASAPTTGVSRTFIAAQVRAVAASVGGYEEQEIDEGASLAGDLGFDSLMLTSIVAQLTKRLPDWRVTETDLGSVTSVGALIDDIHAQLADPVPSAGAPDGEAPTPSPAEALPPAPDDPSALADAAPAPRVELEIERVDSLPEVQESMERIRLAGESDLTLPYYIEHGSVASSTTLVQGEEFISFSSYNYLGLAGHPTVTGAVHAAVDAYGTSASAARILSGNRPLHTELERAISGLIGAEDAVVLVGGHSTNASIIPHLYGPGDLVIHDALVHDSIQQGIKASGASRHAFAHNQVDSLERALTARRGHFRRVLVVTEGVFSMDGDIAELPGIVAAARRHGAHVMADEAHSIGVLGAGGGGVCQELGVDPNEVDILMGTLSKSLSSCGGYIAGRTPFIQHLRYALSSLVFSAGLTPANTAASVAAIDMMAREPERLGRLRGNAQYFLEGAKARGLDTGDAVGVPVVPVILGDSQVAMQVAHRLYENRISANPIIYPAVAESLARLRFFITSEHTHEQLDRALDVTADAVAAVRSVQEAS